MIHPIFRLGRDKSLKKNRFVVEIATKMQQRNFLRALGTGSIERKTKLIFYLQKRV
jgi:hypothetical protein